MKTSITSIIHVVRIVHLNTFFLRQRVANTQIFAPSSIDTVSMANRLRCKTTFFTPSFRFLQKSTSSSHIFRAIQFSIFKGRYSDTILTIFSDHYNHNCSQWADTVGILFRSAYLLWGILFPTLRAKQLICLIRSKWPLAQFFTKCTVCQGGKEVQWPTFDRISRITSAHFLFQNSQCWNRPKQTKTTSTQNTDLSVTELNQELFCLFKTSFCQNRKIYHNKKYRNTQLENLPKNIISHVQRLPGKLLVKCQ